jgi:hypothetical protein
MVAMLAYVLSVGAINRARVIFQSVFSKDKTSIDKYFIEAGREPHLKI